MAKRFLNKQDYGPDPYEFANRKPVTLLSVSNLLHFLRTHGVSAHINLAEGRQAARERFGRNGPSKLRRSMRGRNGLLPSEGATGRWGSRPFHLDVSWLTH